MEQEREVWKGTNEDSCVALCKQFREEGVGFRVEQHAFTYSKRNVQRHFAILVPVDFYEDAKAIVAELALSEDDSDNDDDNAADADESYSIPEAPVSARDVLTAEEREKRERSPRLAEEMIVEIWRDSADEVSAGAVETCLRENEIGCRIGKSPDGKACVFVAADDEKPAREIVRELREGPLQ
jgi:hypothetical protein